MKPEGKVEFPVVQIEVAEFAYIPKSTGCLALCSPDGIKRQKSLLDAI
jgi:hypothetical protein